MPDHPVPKPKTSSLQGSSPGAESDLGELAALFATHGGDGLSAEVSAELALEVVLNEIVEQACLATGATGAAIVLVRDGEMVCRASNGANAPELGAPLGSESGVTAECIKTQQVQRCDDAQSDPRADAEASRSLGVRSVMVLPLLRKGEMAGVLEVFSPLPGAFGDRDEVTLEALAHRILKNLERASEPLALSSGAAKSGVRQNPAAVSALAPEVEESREGPAMRLSREDAVPLKIAGRSDRRAGFDVVSLALGAAVLGCAVLLGAVVGIRLGWRRAASVRGQVMKPASGAVRPPQNAAQSSTRNGVVESGATQIDVEPGTNALAGAGSSGAGNAAAVRNEKKNASVAVSRPAGAKNSFPPGSLLVYENGKEVFRMPPTVEGEAAESAGSENVQKASAQEPAGVVKLALEAAEGSLLHRVEPEYPEEARQQRIQGAVVLEVRIGRDGAVQDVKLISGQPLLADAAIAAVKQWRFKPRMLKGQAVEMQTQVTLNFRMPS